MRTLSIEFLSRKGFPGSLFRGYTPSIDSFVQVLFNLNKSNQILYCLWANHDITSQSRPHHLSVRVVGCGEKMPSEKALVTPFLLCATDGTAGFFGSAAVLSSVERLHPVAVEGGRRLRFLRRSGCLCGSSFFSFVGGALAAAPLDFLARNPLE